MAKGKRMSGRRGMKWVGLAAVGAYAAMGRFDALAQTAGTQGGIAPVLAAQLPVRRYAIGAGPLDAALQQYRAQSEVKLELEIPLAKLATMRSAGVTGLYSNDVALRLLLDGTGLSFRFAGQDTASVGLLDTQTVTVSSPLPDALAMTKFTEPLLDTPQTVVAVPSFVLQDQQNRTLLDAVRNVPGISLAAGESGAQGDSLTIRGFTARNDIFLDGIRDFGSYYRDSFDIDQVEVLEGPAGVQFGRGSTGGVINQESKVPTADAFTNVETQFGTDLTRRITADINRPLPDLAAGSAVRLNAMATEGGVAGRPYAENRRFGIAPSVSFGMNAPSKLTVSYFHFTESDTPDYGLPWFENKLAPGVNRHAYFGFPDENFLRTNDDILTVKANHSFTPSVDVHTIGRWANYPRDVQITEPQICGNVSQPTPVGTYVLPFPVSSANSVPGYSLNTSQVCPLLGPASPAPVTSPIVVNRNQIQIKSVEGDLWDQTELTARFKLAGIRNDFAGGVEGGREVSNPIKYSYSTSVSTVYTGDAPAAITVKGSLNSVTPTTLANPTPADVFSGNGYIASITHLKSQSVGVYFVDVLKLGRFFEASGGVRWDLFDTVFNLYAPANSVPNSSPSANVAPTEQKVTQPTYRAALVFKPNGHGSVYFDYGTSFNPSAESLSLSTSSALLPPEENETFEAGAKYSLLKERLMLEGAWFHTTKDNARETDPTNSNNIVLAGNQLVKGVQASAVGRLGGGTDLVLGYAYLSSQVLYSKLFPNSIGYPLANVPRQTFNFFLTHNLLQKFSAGVGGNYVASRTASSTVPYVPTSYSAPITFASGSAPCATAAYATVTQCVQVLAVGMKQVPGYWVFNLMVKRPVTKRIELQANVYNLLNRFYIDQPHPSHLIPGAGLSALVGANFRF
jgi:catecholate siderophore receptor